MREIVVISGKGGTGKTTVCAAFAALAHAQGQKAVLCDLDVDVPDMHILLDPQVQQEEVLISGNTARINPDLCTSCGRCAEQRRHAKLAGSDSSSGSPSSARCSRGSSCSAESPGSR